MKLKHGYRTLHCEALPDDFTVFKAQIDAGYWYIRNLGIAAKEAVTSCCEIQPVKYYPDYPDKSRWWLICPSCKGAVKAKGDAG